MMARKIPNAKRPAANGYVSSDVKGRKPAKVSTSMPGSATHKRADSVNAPGPRKGR